MLEVSLLSIGLYCANGVGALRWKGGPFGSIILVGSLGWKEEDGVLEK